MSATLNRLSATSLPSGALAACRSRSASDEGRLGIGELPARTSTFPIGWPLRRGVVEGVGLAGDRLQKFPGGGLRLGDFLFRDQLFDVRQRLADAGIGGNRGQSTAPCRRPTARHGKDGGTDPGPANALIAACIASSTIRMPRHRRLHMGIGASSDKGQASPPRWLQCRLLPVTAVPQRRCRRPSHESANNGFRWQSS